ncbi:hypothetical protein CIJ65_07415 [Neisseria meningitidis]|nr:hypothetical protein CIJ65_07415 [Neisseria meningitidis]
MCRRFDSASGHQKTALKRLFFLPAVCGSNPAPQCLLCMIRSLRLSGRYSGLNLNRYSVGSP